MGIVNLYINRCSDYIQYYTDIESDLTKVLENSEVPEDKTRSIVEYFMKSTLEIRRTNIEFYSLHSVYGNSIRNPLHYLRSNDQYWQYDPEADFPAFSETYKQEHFAKTLDTISRAEQAFNEHLLTNENTVDNSQTEF